LIFTVETDTQNFESHFPIKALGNKEVYDPATSKEVELLKNSTRTTPLSATELVRIIEENKITDPTTKISQLSSELQTLIVAELDKLTAKPELVSDVCIILVNLAPYISDLALA
jgi:hypothetical protein